MKTKTKKQKAKPNSTFNLVHAILFISQHINIKDLSDDDRFITNCLINEAADRIIALVSLTNEQSKQIKELKNRLLKAAQ